MTVVSPPPSGAPLLLARLALRIPRVTRVLTAAHATLFLRTRGLLLGRWFGASILVLETVGRRSGKPRRVPIVYLPDGENLAVVPANGGADRPPAWWLNLLAAGEAVAVLGRERWRVRPHETTGAERERLWQRFAAISPLDRYQHRTHRRIPVAVLTPAAPSAERRQVGHRSELRSSQRSTPANGEPVRGPTPRRQQGRRQGARRHARS